MHVKEAGLPEITGPIVIKHATKRIAYAAVLVPGEPDHDGELVDVARVEKAAHEWMESYRNVDLQHTLNNVGVPVESFLLPAEMSVKNIYTGEDMTLPKGTWILGSKTDEETWAKVEKGELTGYSVMGIRRAAMKSADAALKKTLLKDLGEDWIAAAVSFVDEPAVPKAKFFALKAKEEEGKTPDDVGFLERLFGGSSNKEGRRLSKATLTKLRDAQKLIAGILSDEAEEDKEDKAKAGKGGDIQVELTKEDLQEMIDSAVTKGLEGATGQITTLKEELDAKIAGLTADKSADEGNADDKGEDKGESKGDGGDDLEAVKAELREEILKEIEAEFGTKSRAIKGQDDGGAGDKKDEKTPEGYIDRDIHGRRKRVNL